MKYLIAFIVLVLISCSSQKEIQKDVLVYYGKTQCLGKCPVFDLYISKNGTVFYEGFQNVKKKGKFKSKISSNEIVKITEELSTIRSSVQKKTVRDIPNTIIKDKGKTLITQNTKEIERLEKLLQKVIKNI